MLWVMIMEGIHNFHLLSASGPVVGRPDDRTGTCRWCRGLTLRLANRPVTACPTCGATYVGHAAHYWCHAPEAWSIEGFAEFWFRGVEGREPLAPVELAFGRFVSDRAGVKYERILSKLPTVVEQADPIPLGELAREHALLSQGEVLQILDAQRALPDEQRRLFGETAVEFGFWTPDVIAPLLATQAERMRGVTERMCAVIGMSRGDMLEAERAFFGISLSRLTDDPWPIDPYLAVPLESA